MNLKMIPIFLLYVTFSVTSGCATKTQGPVMFEDIDANADGCISMSEAKVRKDLYRNFNEADKDKSGTVCVDEYSAFHNKGRLEHEEVEVPEVGAAPVR